VVSVQAFSPNRIASPRQKKKPLFLIAMPCRLPAIQQELNKFIEKTNIELHDLPSPPSSEPLREVLRLITDLTRAVEIREAGQGGTWK
jgi:hypothetical protein